nr:hypothetical protein [Bacilli bacterium]
MKCMCNVYQKFYSALKNLDSISIENNFFDNVSFFDNFFNEFRSITFTLQAEIDNDKNLLNKYQTLKEKYLMNKIMKWCNNTRVDVTHKRPIQLNKVIDVDIYYIDKTSSAIHYDFDIAIDDTPQKEIEKEITKKFTEINTTAPEIYFTINYNFYDKKENINIFENINEILENMYKFLEEFCETLEINCKNCTLLKEKTTEKLNNIIAKKLELQLDGVFNTKTKKIEYGSYATIFFADSNGKVINMPRTKVNGNILLHGDNINDYFLSFIIQHVLLYVLQEKHIIPTFYIFYDNGTFTIKPFMFNNKASIYKEISLIAKSIESDKIIAVFLVNEMYGYRNIDTMKLPYEKRIKYSNVEYLSFSMIDKDLNEKYYLIDTKNLNTEDDAQRILKNLKKYETYSIMSALLPIKISFQNLK